VLGDGSSGSAATTIYEWNSALSIESKGLVVAILCTVIKILFMHTEFWTMEYGGQRNMYGAGFW